MKTFHLEVPGKDEVIYILRSWQPVDQDAWHFTMWRYTPTAEGEGTGPERMYVCHHLDLEKGWIEVPKGGQTTPTLVVDGIMEMRHTNTESLVGIMLKKAAEDNEFAIKKEINDR